MYIINLDIIKDLRVTQAHNIAIQTIDFYNLNLMNLTV